MPIDRDLSRARDAYERALDLLRARATKWEDDVCTIKRSDKRFELDTAMLASDLEKRASAYRAETLALIIADALGLPADPELVLEDVTIALPLLRPRFVRPDVLDGPGRNLVRREIGEDLLLGVSLGRRTRRNFVITRMLDAWGMGFDETLKAAIDEVLRRFDTSAIVPFEDDPCVLAVTDVTEPAASLARGSDRMVDGLDDWPGCLLGMPSEDTLLIVPLDDDATLKDLGALIRATYGIANVHPRPLTPLPCWLYRGRLHTLGLRMDEMESEHGKRHATVETNAPEAAHLLRMLAGEETGPPPERDEGGALD